MVEADYYPIVRKWLEGKGYYCGGNIYSKGDPIYYENIGTKERRADVAGVKNLDNRYEDELEIVAIEVKDKPSIQDLDIRETANYQHCAHKCYLATTAEITEKDIEKMEKRNLGLLKIEKNKDITVKHNPKPEHPRNYDEMLAFLASYHIFKCAFCGTYFERFNVTDKKTRSYLEIKRAKYFNATKDKKYNILNFGDIRKLPKEYKITRYICHPCLDEFWFNTARINKMKNIEYNKANFHAYWDKTDRSFYCVNDDCTDPFDTIEIVKHLEKKHEIKPEDQIIEGWTDKHEKKWEKYKLKNSRTREAMVN